MADEDKQALRARVRARRAAADPSARARAARRWTGHVLDLLAPGPGSVIAAYSSYGTEPPTAHLLAELAGSGADVLLPVLRPDRDLDWTRDGELVGLEGIAAADAVVVPALLVGLDAARLGQGGGSYDRALPRRREGVPVVALIHDDELVDAGLIPSEPHDVRVTHAIGPSGVTELPATRGTLR